MNRRKPVRVPGRLLALVLLLAGLLQVRVARAQEGSTIPPDYRGTTAAVARGILDGNLIETNFRNHAEMSRWDDWPWGIWPRSVGGRHIDGIAMVVAGQVRGEREKWWGISADWNGRPDTVLHPVSINYRDAGKKTGPDGGLWGWLPLPGFHNQLRRNPITNNREPNPALSDDPTTWPANWPDRLTEQDAGWPGKWNGLFGKNVFNADLESYYVIDDLSDKEYHVDRQRRRPYSEFGVFYPDPTDSTKGGMGLQVGIRLLQWANVLAEDAMFLLYRITNVGQTNYGEMIDLPRGPVESGLWFTQFVDYGLGNEEGDENAAFNPQLDIAFGYDQDGIGQYQTGGTYPLGYTGFAFLESPADAADQLDNDEDGMTDESRFSGPGERIDGQEAIRAYVDGHYDMANFVRVNGPLEQRPAYVKGVWWTGDENLDWVGFDDANNNGRYDTGELLNDDYGRDGLGPNDVGYPGPDDGEADGIPTIREPNFDELDVDESDQIGLTGFHLSTRPFYENGDNLRDDSWMWARIQESQFELGTDPTELVADVEPFLNFSSGPVSLRPQRTDFFSTAWIFGEDEQDFFRNRETVQRIYNADYRFAQPPITPRLTAQAGDGFVTLSWDTLSLASFDRFTQEFDFEGYKLFKGTDPLLSDAKVVTDYTGTPMFYKPLRQWDVKNGIKGVTSINEGEAVFDLGNDTGLEFSYIDRDVTNGKTYYYAIVAYDRGFIPDADSPNPNAAPVDPQQNVFNVSVDQGGNVRGFSSNVAIVVPRADAAGFVAPNTREDLSKPTSGIGTGSLAVTVLNNQLVDSTSIYRVTFFDTTNAANDLYRTTSYSLVNVTKNQVLIPRSPLVETTPMMDGFVVDIFNQDPEIDQARTGWMAGTGANVEFSRSPSDLADVDPLYGQFNWLVVAREDTTSRFVASPYEYELVWADSMYTTPSRPRGFLSGKQLPFWCRNVTLNASCDIVVEDVNKNGEVDYFLDDFILHDLVFGSVAKFRHRVRFAPIGEGTGTPGTGARVRISTQRPFAEGDYFQFSLRSGFIDPNKAKSDLDRIAVVPNPYVMAAEWEPRTQITGRGARMVQFIHLPERCTIKIFTMRGELIRTLEHDGVGGDGAEFWDLKTENRQDIAYGVYFFHVEAPGIGEKTGKFAIIK